MSQLRDKTQKKIQQEPLWKGPCDSGPQGGITQSMIGDYLGCPERFRIKVIEGLRTVDSFNKYLEFGNMWHICEETAEKDRELTLRKYATELVKKYPMQSDEINKWYNVVKVQYPVYLKYWKTHEQQKSKKSLLREVSFRVPYRLPSDRVVWLRGKWDAVDIVTVDGVKGIWLTDHKTKSEIDPIKMLKQLPFDLQTMTYLVALKTLCNLVNNGIDGDIETDPIRPIADELGKMSRDFSSEKIGGFFYNVIKRPLSGGKGTIRQHQPTKTNPQGESLADFYARLGSIIEESADEFFARWTVPISADDIEKFERTCLIPILENLCDDYEWWNYCVKDNKDVFDSEWRAECFRFHNPAHFRLPYGTWNVLAEGGSHDLDEYLETGVTTGLQRADRLFNELED